MYLIDTSIFLELLLGQNRATDAKKFLHLAVNGDIQTHISRFSVYSIEIILQKNNQLEVLNAFLEILGHAKGIKVISTDLQDDKRIVTYIKSLKLDFDDALQYYLCKTLNLHIVSFDKHFDKTDIKRLEPKDILKKKK